MLLLVDARALAPRRSTSTRCSARSPPASSCAGCSREGHESLEVKLTGLAFGLLIPVFFITSGMAIDPAAVAQEPLALVLFVLLILLVRGGGVYVATRTSRIEQGRAFDNRESLAMALFGSTGCRSSWPSPRSRCRPAR